MVVSSFLLLIVLPVSAQDIPLFNIPSPEVANLGLYGQIPVSHFTGVPDISIPLYEIEVGSLNMPITANYHLSAVKPNTIPSSLSLGWSLMVGGYITRHVRGAYDEIMDSNGNGHGLYTHYAKLKNITYSQFDTHMSYLNDNNEWYELSADEFSFNFCGYSGNFYYNENGGWTVVSDQDIKVEFSPVDGFATLNDVGTRINLSRWGDLIKSRNQRFFKKFTLITPDGARYEFGGINAMEFSIPYYARKNSDLIVSAWRLTKITTPEKHTITLEYDTSPRLCDLQYIPMYRDLYGLLTNNSNPHKYGLSGFTGFLLFPVNLKKITTPNETINFNYERDTTFGERFLPNGVKALYWEELGNIRGNAFTVNHEDPAEQFFIFMNDVDRADSQNETRRNFASALKYYLLDNISIQNEEPLFSKKIFFKYQVAGRKKLMSIIEAKTELSDTISVKGMPSYFFGYNSDILMQNDFIVSTTDSWGYYHGGRKTFSSAPTSYDVIQPNEAATKAEVLTSIVYPTGGRTLFEYELNNYSQIVDTTRTRLLSESNNSGGLRIKKITNINHENDVTSIKRYYYSKEHPHNGTQPSSGICMGMPVHNIIYNLSGDGYFIQRSQSAYYVPVTNHNTPDVGYSWVIEETFNSSNYSQGYIRYQYSNYDTDIYGEQHFDSLSLHAYNTNSNCYLAPYTSLSFERGKLLTKEYFDCNGNLMKKESYKYQRTSHVPMLTACQEVLNLGQDPYNNIYMASIGWLVNTHTASYLPSTRIDTICIDSVKTKFVGYGYLYNSHKKISSESYSLSDGQTGIITYKYPFDFPEYSWMTNSNITNPIVKKEETVEGLTRTETNMFMQTATGVPYINKKTISHGSASPKTTYEVLHVDNYGNPQEIYSHGKHSVLLWGCKGQRLVARIENGDYNSLQSAINFTSSSESVNYISLYNARNNMPTAHFYIFGYNKKMLVDSAITPDRQTTYYDYDVMGRLKASYCGDYIIEPLFINIYDYQYYNDNINSEE